MKRKLAENGVPVEVIERAKPADHPKFEAFELDARLMRSIAKEKFTKPTPVQAEAIPLALAGKDILGSRTRISQGTRDVLISD
jgi:ATP-dependent RNA helicase DDX56/DBP9